MVETVLSNLIVIFDLEVEQINNLKCVRFVSLLGYMLSGNGVKQ